MTRASSVWVDDAAALVEPVRSGSVVAVGGFHFTRIPVAQLRALARHGVANLHYLSWGGGLALELLLDAGAVDRATLTFSSLDLFGLAPRFRASVEQGTLELDEWTALAMIKGLEAAGENLPYGVFQTPAGSDLASRFAVAPSAPDHAGAPLAIAPALSPDTLLLHAQRADDAGNVELAGARGLDRSLLFASRNVLVSVEERVPDGTLGAPGSFVVPRAFVTRLAQVPAGAYPTSCLPHYVADYSRLQEIAEQEPSEPLAENLFDPQDATLVRAIAARRPEQLRRRLLAVGGEIADRGPWTIDELMAVWIARQLDDSSVCSIGSASPLPTAGYLLARRLWAPNLTMLSFNGGLVDIAPRPLCLLAAEALDQASARVHAGGDETYHWYYQRGFVTHEIVSAAQIDRLAVTNNVRVARADGSEVRLPGQGGMADVANLHANFVLYLARHSRRALVETVAFASARRTFRDPDVRRGFGLQPGAVRLITNLGVFVQPGEGEGGLELTSLHPGVRLEEVREQTGFDVVVARDIAETGPPTDEELTVLRREVDPLGIRRLDFSPAAERGELIRSIVRAERNALCADHVGSAA